MASANSSERIVNAGAQRASVSPRFDENSIRRARPAVPLWHEGVRERRPRTLLLLAAVAVLAGVCAGVVGMILYQRRGTSPARETAGERAQTHSPAAPQAPAAEQTAAADGVSGAETTPAEAPPTAGADGVVTATTGSGADDQAALRDALAGWVGATNARDVGRQMSFYVPRLEAYYLAHGASAAAVRAEKQRVLGRAQVVNVQTDAPSISLSPDGLTATMRFRKRYQIAGPGFDNRGEVVQELRWRKTAQGWKIVGERDLRVLD